MKAWLASLVLPLAVVALVSAAWGNEVRFPLQVDYELLQSTFRTHLREQGAGGVDLWRSANGCGSFALRNISIEPAGDRLRITGPASATAGISLFGLCWANIAWSGRAEIVARPEIGPDW